MTFSYIASSLPIGLLFGLGIHNAMRLDDPQSTIAGACILGIAVATGLVLSFPIEDER